MIKTPIRPWLALAACSLMLSGCSDDPAPGDQGSLQPISEKYPITWRFALEEIEGSVQHQYAEAFRTHIEDISDGLIEVDVFPYGSLGTSTQLTELARNGSVNLAFASPGHLADTVPEAGIFNLHFLMPEQPEDARQLLDDPELISQFQQPYQQTGLHLLGFIPEG
ncbi:MAG TPA: TRAP transporter substrate-binding protein DctP, partial [Marinobacter sp.]|nr:TRAP transporter substrate-binding protein DctP [Marinobacter sp.]